MKIEIKKVSFSERFSEETNCFVADLYINGKKVGYCKNDGHGGNTYYHGYSLEDNKVIREAEKYCKSLPNVKCEELNFEYEQRLDNYIDELLENYLKAKDAEKQKRKLAKDIQSAICYGIPNSNAYRLSFWTNRLTKKKVLLIQIPKENLQKTYNDIKKNLKNGEVILNDNLASLGIVL